MQTFRWPTLKNHSLCCRVWWESSWMIQWITSSQDLWVMKYSLIGRRSQTKMAVGNSMWWHTNENYLRYSRADWTNYTKVNQTLISKQLKQIYHRSVGEPAEGSLTRIHVINPLRMNVPKTILTPPYTSCLFICCLRMLRLISRCAWSHVYLLER